LRLPPPKKNLESKDLTRFSLVFAKSCFGGFRDIKHLRITEIWISKFFFGGNGEYQGVVAKKVWKSRFLMGPPFDKTHNAAIPLSPKGRMVQPVARWPRRQRRDSPRSLCGKFGMSRK
jgi:hypothetical protein